MTGRSGCPDERQVIEEVVAGRLSAERRAHVDGCRSCQDALAAAEAIRADAEALAFDAPVPTAGAMWWRLQMRKELEATRRAERPIAVAQLLALASVAGATVAGSVVVFDWATKVWAGQGPAPGGTAPLAGITELATLVASSLPLTLAAVLFAAIVPLVVYVAVARE